MSEDLSLAKTNCDAGMMGPEIIEPVADPETASVVIASKEAINSGIAGTGAIDSEMVHSGVSDRRTGKWEVNIPLFPAIVAGIIIVNFAFVSVNTYYTAKNHNTLAANVEAYQKEVNAYQKEIEKLRQEVAGAKEEAKKAYDMGQVSSSLSALTANDTAGLLIARDLRVSGVTGSLVVENAIYNLAGDSLLDVACQPTFAKNYAGQGKFSISERELKLEFMDLIERVKTVYNSYKKPSMKEFSKTTITVTVKGYDVGVYENGNLKLKEGILVEPAKQK